MSNTKYLFRLGALLHLILVSSSFGHLLFKVRVFKMFPAGFFAWADDLPYPLKDNINKMLFFRRFKE